MALVEYACGRVRGRRGRWLRQHCLVCEACGEQLAALILLRRSTLPRRVRNWAPRRVAVAAAMMALVIAAPWAAAAWRGSAHQPAVAGGAPTLESARANSSAELTSVEFVAEVAGLRDRVRIFEMIYLGEARSAAAEAEGDRQRLGLALRSLQTGEMDEMIEQLQPFAQRYHVHGTPLLGAARYVVGERDEATLWLLQQAAAQVRKDAADPSLVTMQRVGVWYLARLQRERGDRVAAAHWLSVLGAVDDRLGRDARAWLNSGDAALR